MTILLLGRKIMSNLIEEKDVTIVYLAVELERAVIEHDLEDDKSIYVNEDTWFPFWVHASQSSGFVSFKTYTNFKKSTNKLQRLELCNELNNQNFLVTAYVQDDRLTIDYVLNFRDGLLRETFIRTCRQFPRNIEHGLKKVDPECDFILPPGKTEPEDEESQ
jgi:Putative bacterial sensory transduction regulator